MGDNAFRDVVEEVPEEFRSFWISFCLVGEGTVGIC